MVDIQQITLTDGTPAVIANFSDGTGFIQKLNKNVEDNKDAKKIEDILHLITYGLNYTRGKLEKAGYDADLHCQAGYTDNSIYVEYTGTVSNIKFDNPQPVKEIAKFIKDVAEYADASFNLERDYTSVYE